MMNHVCRSSLIAGVVVVLGALPGCGSRAATEAAPGPVEAVGSHPLHPGDVVRLRIWREPTLSDDYVVDATGAVTLPKIGSIRVTGLTASELELEIREEYDRFLRNPSIEITLLRRVNILGAVRTPGLYPVDPTMTLRDALAMAGGVLPGGPQDRVELIRAGERRVVGVTGTTRVADLGMRSGDQLYVPERSWLSRNAGVVATVASTALSVAASLIIAFHN